MLKKLIKKTAAEVDLNNGLTNPAVRIPRQPRRLSILIVQKDK